MSSQESYKIEAGGSELQREKGDMTAEPEVGMMCFEDGGKDHEQRKAGSL